MSWRGRYVTPLVKGPWHLGRFSHTINLLAVLWTLLAGGAGIFLGCMDVLFDLEHGIYTTRPADNASAPLIEIALNLITFTFGGAIIVWIWRHRAAYLGTR